MICRIRNDVRAIDLELGNHRDRNQARRHIKDAGQKAIELMWKYKIHSHIVAGYPVTIEIRWDDISSEALPPRLSGPGLVCKGSKRLDQPLTA
jgi:hypothetical protein